MQGHYGTDAYLDLIDSASTSLASLNHLGVDLNKMVLSQNLFDINSIVLDGLNLRYELFADRLYPSIRRIHGNTTHCGKNSPSAKSEQAKPEPTKEDKISQLKTELDKAVEQQNFERAAELRDQIKGMEA